MELDSTFAVSAPIEEVWTSMMDVEQVAGCVPGARVLNQLAEDTYQVGMKVRLGPVSMQYRGQVEIVERDDVQHRAVLRGKGKEARGQGTADATVELRLAETDGETHGTVHADVKLSGKAAAMGQGVIGDVAQQMVAEFAANLQAMVLDPAVDERSGETVEEAIEVAAAGSQHAGVERPPEDATPRTSPVEQTRDDEDMTQGQHVTGPGQAGGPRIAGPSLPPTDAPVSGGAQSSPGARAADRIAGSGQRPPQHRAIPADDDEGTSLDGLALAAGILKGRLADPRSALALVALVALLAYRLGRRSRPGGGFRSEDLEQLARLLDRR